MNKSLKKYITENIKPYYKTFDSGHDISHYNFVTQNCINYGKELRKRGIDINLDIAFVVGAYHDIGILKGREGHAKSSGEILRADTELKKYFNEKTIEIMAEAVEDHSSHRGEEPRNIYGKIVADADRNNNLYLYFSRPIKYGLKSYPELDRMEHINRAYNFVQEKFGKNGYVHFWLDIPQTTMGQGELWNLLDNKTECLAYISGLFDEITKGKFCHKK